MMEELRNFITTDNHEAVKIGDLEKNTGIASSGETHTNYPETLRRGEEGTPRTFIDTTNAGDKRWCHRSWMCERVVLGKGAKVLISESAQGICPPHPGRQS